MSHPLRSAGVTLVAPRPVDLVLAAALVRPGIDLADLPRFGDGSWQLAYLSTKDTATSIPVHWTRFPAEFRDTFKRPPGLCSTSRPRMSSSPGLGPPAGLV
ncbi:hypothetical protein [Amycolatopsis sp. cmx-8-4]|uniref:hypothetical protein n=1 Tax=Amycolatopsis sp. cmx-8-4 TaxID=2790947 RepID=UPI00397E7A27